ncbi:hypothetical protein DL765_011669 [Monosporascus sp. GIB2]|nr:hypothetical protein DL765_011669 [Monosporascus sp. GIB2]
MSALSSVTVAMIIWANQLEHMHLQYQRPTSRTTPFTPHRWTRHLKSLELIREYQDSEYLGPAIKVGAGIEGGEAYDFANAHGLMVVGGNCPNVGIAGGYTQGGGISILSSKYGLAADQVLSWEVITSSGALVTASPTENTDLFWALRGGGGSTLVDAGAWVVWVAAPFGFMITPAMVAGLRPAELDVLFETTLNKMDQLGLQYQYSSAEHPNFLSSYSHITSTSTLNVSDYNMGSRLIPRELVEDDISIEALVGAIRYITSQTFMSGVAFNVANAVASPRHVSANPYLRKTIFNAAIGTPINYSDWTANKAMQDKITYDLLPVLQSITPNGGVYLNEADFQAPDFQTTFYGDHYKKLFAIKQKYDPDKIFYAKTAVGSDRWEQRLDGRLCTT